jgi:hypothetical protein
MAGGASSFHRSIQDEDETTNGFSDASHKNLLGRRSGRLRVSAHVCLDNANVVIDRMTSTVWNYECPGN